MAKKSGVDESQVLVFLTSLCEQDCLSANVQIRCPECDQDHGTYPTQSSVPDEEIVCFCGTSFEPSEKLYWTVVYEFQEAVDFFPNLRAGFEQFIDSGSNLSGDYFLSKLAALEELEDNSTRGRYFDYFIGLLFDQLPGVKVFVGDEVSLGEIDVFVTCLDAPEWLYRLCGDAIMIENKWQVDPVQTKEISAFHDKVKFASTTCKLCYFISMSGFTSGRNMSAAQLIQSKTEPKMAGLTSEDVDKMVRDGTPADLLRARVM